MCPGYSFFTELRPGIRFYKSSLTWYNQAKRFSQPQPHPSYSTLPLPLPAPPANLHPNFQFALIILSCGHSTNRCRPLSTEAGSGSDSTGMDMDITVSAVSLADACIRSAKLSTTYITKPPLNPPADTVLS